MCVILISVKPWLMYIPQCIMMFLKSSGTLKDVLKTKRSPHNIASYQLRERTC